MLAVVGVSAGSAVVRLGVSPCMLATFNPAYEPGLGDKTHAATEEGKT